MVIYTTARHFWCQCSIYYIYGSKYILEGLGLSAQPKNQPHFPFQQFGSIS